MFVSWSVNEQNVVYVHKMEYYLAMKRSVCVCVCVCVCVIQSSKGMEYWYMLQL